MAAAVTLFLFGAATVALSLQLPIGTFRSAGSGLFPLILGLLLMGLATGHGLRLLRAPVPAAGFGVPPTGSYRRVTLFFGAVAAATALLAPLGFLPASFLLLFVLMEILGVRPRILALGVSLLMPATFSPDPASGNPRFTFGQVSLLGESEFVMAEIKKQ